MKMYNKFDTLHVHWTRTQTRSCFKAANGLFAGIRLVSGLEKTLALTHKNFANCVLIVFWLYTD